DDQVSKLAVDRLTVVPFGTHQVFQKRERWQRSTAARPRFVRCGAVAMISIAKVLYITITPLLRKSLLHVSSLGLGDDLLEYLNRTMRYNTTLRRASSGGSLAPVRPADA